jgi:putative transposase
MSEYKRFYQPGGHYFFTLVTHKRKSLFNIPENITHLKTAIQKVKTEYPFKLEAMVLLPDHLHCIWKLPNDSQDFSTRWRLIKRYFSMQVVAPLNHRHEKQVWQRRFWEHAIRNERDWQQHIDYIHYNPVKHGYAVSAKEWPHSTFHLWVQKGLYDAHWGLAEPKAISKMAFE